MHKVNEYSELYKKKETQQLLDIVRAGQYTTNARLAAVWELENRNELPDDLKELAEQLTNDWDRVRTRVHDQMKYKTFWPRFLASIIDGLALMILLIIPGLFIAFDRVIFTSPFYNEVFFELLVYAYYIFMHAKYGQTLGKMTMNIKVVRYSDEQPIGWKEAYMRDLVPVALVLLLVFLNALENTGSVDFYPLYPTDYVDQISTGWFLAEVVTMLTNEKRRAVHDFMAGTVVIRTH